MDLNDGGWTIGMSLVVLMDTVATLVPALLPMYGTSPCKVQNALMELWFTNRGCLE